MAVFLVCTDMVSPFPHAFRAQNIIDVDPLPRMNPSLHHIIHVAVEFAMLVAERRMVEDTIDVIQHLIRRNIGMLPGIDDPRGDILKDCCRNLARRLIENVGKMVFRKERMGRIRAVWIGPRFILMLAAGVDYA